MPTATAALRVALLGNPNTGKTTLFNRLCALRHKTSNFPGTTQESRVGRIAAHAGHETNHVPIDLIDLPGVYSLELDQIEATICREVLAGRGAPDRVERAPDAVCIVVDATNLVRNLMLVGEALSRGLPAVLAVNMIDLAERRGLSIDAPALSRALGCEAVLICARTGRGKDQLLSALERARTGSAPGVNPGAKPPRGAVELERWAEAVYARAVRESPSAARARAEAFTDRADAVTTHPVLGTLVFAAVMTGLFWVIFALAQYPMGWIEWAFALAGDGVKAALPPGFLGNMLADGVIGGVAGVVVFLPQIFLLFVLIALLEDTGYLARAAFLMDRLLRPFGLPGHAFVPLLSSHACALPGIIAARAVPDRRERLATILVAPFMTCSARLPVYVLLTSLLFDGKPALAALAFVGCYALGAMAGLLSALIARRTILRGRSMPMALELPAYKAPSVRTALVTGVDRSWMFIRKAGTNILAICVVLWWLSHFPRPQPPAEAAALRAQAQALVQAGAGEEDEPVRALADEATRLEDSHALRHSFAGRLGRLAEPAFAPLGYDWQLSIGVLTSFAAREVFVSTMRVVLAGEDSEDNRVSAILASATRDDGTTRVFAPATAWSLLVFFVLAMQCLPTLVVTAREAGGARWAVLQFVWMSGVAYLAALATHTIVSAGAA